MRLSSMYANNIIGSGPAAVYFNLQHILTVTGSVLFFKETLASYHYYGFALVLAGVALSLTRSRQAKHQAMKNELEASKSIET